jgi:anti-sigma B factor antagonist
MFQVAVRGDSMGRWGPDEHLLSIQVEQCDGVARIRLAGELDMSGRDRFERALMAAETHGSRAVLVDLSHVVFMDSSALGVLLGAHDRTTRAEQKLIVRGAGGEVWRLIQLAGAHDVFDGAELPDFPELPGEYSQWQPVMHSDGELDG